MPPHAAPTTARGEVTMGPEELFFSTTDARGVIRQGNSVFARISGHALDTLIGAPHNIVRHPDMPAGVFHLMWEWLQSGRPVGTYVCNRTADGGHYWVCAVVSPMDDGYISVRMAPRGPILDVVRIVYQETAAAERAATARGLNRREVAEVGRQEVEAALARRGFASYEEFMRTALPEEMKVRDRLASSTYQRPDATGETAEILQGAREVDAILDGVVRQLVGYRAISEDLATVSAHVLHVGRQLQGSVAAAQAASALVATKSPVLGNVAKVMGTPMGEAIADLEKIPAAFDKLRSDLAQMRFQVALAALHNDMAAAFAAEVHDGEAPTESLSAIPLLGDAVERRAADMAQQLQLVNNDLREVSTLAMEAGKLLEDFRRMIGQWRHLAFRHANAELKDHVKPIDEAISSTWSSTEQLHILAGRAASAAVPFDPSSLRGPLATMRVQR